MTMKQEKHVKLKQSTTRASSIKRRARHRQNARQPGQMRISNRTARMKKPGVSAHLAWRRQNAAGEITENKGRRKKAALLHCKQSAGAITHTKEKENYAQKNIFAHVEKVHASIARISSNSWHALNIKTSHCAHLKRKRMKPKAWRHSACINAARK